MAEEINFIRPQDVYDRNTGESKVRYRSYDGNDRFIPVADGEKGVPKTMVEVTHAELKAMRDGGKLTAGALYRITDYNCTTTQENTQSAGHQFDIVLLALSKNKLAEEGWAMMHDNIYDVTFNDGVTKKCYLYGPYDIDGSPNYNLVDTSTLLGYSELLYGEFTIEGNTIIVASAASNDLIEENLPYNYFQNSNISAWKVWYCLDNDTTRFAWAATPSSAAAYSLTIDFGGREMSCTATRDESRDSGEFKCFVLSINGGAESSVWIKSETLSVGTVTTYIEPSEDARTSELVITSVTELPPIKATGVIYRLIDEFNNDIKYDFKNIQFKRKLTDGQYDATNGTDTWCYTLNIWYNGMCQDASIVGNTLPNDEGYVKGVYDNVFGYTTVYDFSIEGVDTFAFALGDNVVLSFCDVDGYYYGIYSNTIGNSFYSNTIGESFNSNTIRNNFHSNTIGNGFESNTIGNGFNTNTIGNNFCANIIGNYFNDNIIGDDFDSNTVGNVFGNKTISDNTRYKNYGNNGVELATKS